MAKILPMQQSDFEAMYKALEGRPMTVRYLDHRCMSSCLIWTWKTKSPSWPRIWAVLWKEVRAKITALHRSTHDGSPRLPSASPIEIAEMQTRAVMQAAINDAQGMRL